MISELAKQRAQNWTDLIPALAIAVLLSDALDTARSGGRHAEVHAKHVRSSSYGFLSVRMLYGKISSL